PTTLFVDGFGRRLNPAFRLLVLPALGFATVGVTVAAADSASRERERRTLDGLLCLPRGRDELLRAWWLGGLWHLRPLLGGPRRLGGGRLGPGRPARPRGAAPAPGRGRPRGLRRQPGPVPVGGGADHGAGRPRRDRGPAGRRPAAAAGRGLLGRAGRVGGPLLA